LDPVSSDNCWLNSNGLDICKQADVNSVTNSESVDFIISAMVGGGSTSHSGDSYSSLVVEENPIDNI